MSAPEPDALADEIRVSSAASEGRTLFEDAYSAQLDYLNLLRAINARFLAIGGGLVSLEARVLELEHVTQRPVLTEYLVGSEEGTLARDLLTAFDFRIAKLEREPNGVGIGLHRQLDALDKRLSERLMALEERGIGIRPEAIEELARRPAPNLLETFDWEKIRHAIKRDIAEEAGPASVLRGFAARANALLEASSTWVHLKRETDLLLTDLARLAP